MTPDHPQEITVVRLADETIDQLAARVADLLTKPADARTAAPGPAARGASGLLSAAKVSEWWGVERGYVYRHADQLGAIRIGTGRRPRLRFDPERVRQTMGEPTAPGERKSKPHSSRHKPDMRRSGTSVSDSHELLPINEKQSYGR